MAEAVRLGIVVRPPHVNFSGEAFTLAEYRIGSIGVWKEAASARTSRRIGERAIGRGRDNAPRTMRHAIAILYMGLGQVRDLRHSAHRGTSCWTRPRRIHRAARSAEAGGAAAKEIDHLIRCGALDGLAESRAVLLAEVEEIRHVSAAQMTFDFARPEVPAETPRQRWDWEAELLGLPVSAFADPLALVRERLPAHLPWPSWPAPAAGRSRQQASGCRAGRAAPASSWAMAAPS